MSTFADYLENRDTEDTSVMKNTFGETIQTSKAIFVYRVEDPFSDLFRCRRRGGSLSFLFKSPIAHVHWNKRMSLF